LGRQYNEAVVFTPLGGLEAVLEALLRDKGRRGALREAGRRVVEGMMTDARPLLAALRPLVDDGERPAAQ
jgi:hypothetical protein